MGKLNILRKLAKMGKLDNIQEYQKYMDKSASVGKKLKRPLPFPLDKKTSKIFKKTQELDDKALKSLFNVKKPKIYEIGDFKYEISHQKGSGIRGRILDKNNKEIGRGDFGGLVGDETTPVLYPHDIYVDDAYQKQNLATNLYKIMEKHTNRKVLPSGVQTESGRMFHSKKGFGQNFGLDEKTVDSIYELERQGDFDSIKEMLKSKGITGKTAASIMATLGATTAMTPEEAQAAGIMTIIKRLNLTGPDAVEKAKAIKKLADTKPAQDVFEQNIKDINVVKQFRKDPKSLPLLDDLGADRTVYDLGDRVLKVPKTKKDWYSKTDVEEAIYPGALEAIGAGPKTTSIKAGDSLYQVQPKLETFESPRWGVDPEYKKADFLEKEAIKETRAKAMGMDVEKTLEEYRALYPKEAEKYGTNIQHILDHPEYYYARNMERKLQNELRGTFKPQDIHEKNIGKAPEGDIQVFDTSRFKQPNIPNLTPEMKKKIVGSYIATPESKKVLQESLESGKLPPGISPKKPEVPTTPDILKKAAAGAPLGLVANNDLPITGEMGDTQYPSKEYRPKGEVFIDKTVDLGKEYAGKGLDLASDYGKRALAEISERYKALDPETKVNIDATLETLSMPSGALRAATHAAQTGQPILEATKKGWDDPYAAPTGADIAEATGLDDEGYNYLGKAAIATAADFADPIDLLGLGAIAKTGRIGKAKKITGK